jgi:hypothetical protein
MYMKKSHIAAWLAAAVLAGSLMAGCGDTQTTQPKSSAGSAEQGASGSLVPALSQDELIAQSSLIIKGTVSEVSDTFQVKPETGGDASSYVDNTVRMEQTLRGQTDADTVTVRVQDDDQASTEDAKLEQGKEYLLFLTASGEDNTYRVTGAMQGAYEVQADGTCVAWDGTKWTLQDAQKAIEQAK